MEMNKIEKTLRNLMGKHTRNLTALLAALENVQVESYLCEDHKDLDLIHTRPAYTNDGKPFDFMVREKVESGRWRLECIKPSVVGLARPIEVYRAVRSQNNIIKPWSVTAAEQGYCSTYWADIAIGEGACSMRCRTCFLILTHRCKCDPSRHVLYENLDDYVVAVIRFLMNPSRKNIGLGIDCSDSLLYEGVTGHARHTMLLVGDPEINPKGCKLILLTKSTNIHYLKGYRSKNVVLSFSLNPEPIADLWEGKWNDGIRITPSIEKRLLASLEGQEMGFEVRWRIDPIFPLDHWQDYYLEFFHIAARTGHRPARITLGTYREMGPSLLTFSERWGLPPMEWKTSTMTRDGSHYHISAVERVAIYRFLKAAIEDGWKHTGHQPIVALCKETSTVRKATGITHDHCNCE